MSKRFIIGIDESNEDQNQEFLNFLKANDFGWWHWIDNLWLLTTDSDKHDAVSLSNKLNSIYPSIRRLVIELNKDGDTWAGFGPSSKVANMFDWLNSDWEDSTRNKT